MSNDSYCINDNNGISSTLGNQSDCYWPSVWTNPNSTELGNVSISAIKACCGTSELIDYPLNDQYNCVIQYCHFPPPNGDDTIMRCFNDVFLSGNSSIQVDLFCTGMDDGSNCSKRYNQSDSFDDGSDCIWELGSLKKNLANFKRL